MITETNKQMESGRNIQIDSARCDSGMIALITITNRQGSRVTLSSLGAAIVSVVVPDRNGNLADVVRAPKTLESSLGNDPTAGKVTAPFADRLWTARVVADNSIEFSCSMQLGDDGTDGTLNAKATYVWTDDNTLELYLTATSDYRTVVDLGNSTCFNLNGEGSVLDNTLYLNASHYLPTDSALVPTGIEAPVAGTPMDFTKAKRLGADIRDDFPALVYGNGYDSCWVIDDWVPDLMNEAAVLASADSRRQLNVYTTYPLVQVCTAKEGRCPEPLSGRHPHDCDAVAIACRGFPRAATIPGFPSPELRPGEEYRQLVFFEFRTF